MLAKALALGKSIATSSRFHDFTLNTLFSTPKRKEKKQGPLESLTLCSVAAGRGCLQSQCKEI